MSEGLVGWKSPEPPRIESLTCRMAPFLMKAEPEPLEVDIARTAVVVIDMQNAFVSKGGIHDRWGREISKVQAIIPAIKRITDTARANSVKVIHVAHVHAPDLHDSGGPDSPNWTKRVLREYREHPEWRRGMQVGGYWGAEIIDELKPQPGDIYVPKPRFSAFFGTNMDAMLKTYGLKYLIFLGVSSNICVETSIRDAFNLDYFCVLASDASTTSGPQSVHDAVLSNVRGCFGWVSDTASICAALESVSRSKA